MILIPRMTVIAIQSGIRVNVYANREFEENQLYYERIVNEGDFREKELTQAALTSSVQEISLDIWPHFKRTWRNIIYRSSLKCGISPFALRNFIKYSRKGGFIDRLRANRGLESLS